MAVSNPKQRCNPRATLYSPPPSLTRKWRAVPILYSPGSKRSITSPRLTTSQRQPVLGLMGRGTVSSARQPAAVDGENVSVHIIAGGGAQKKRGAGDVLRFAPARRGNSLENLPTARRVVAQGRGVVRGHISRRDGVHVDPFGGPFIRKGFRQLRDPALCCGISRNQYSSLEREQRSNVQDFAARGAFQHIPPRKLRQAKHRRQVDVDHFIPEFHGIFRGGSPANHSGVVHQNVDGAELGDGFFNKRRGHVRLGQISGKVKGLSPRGNNLSAGGASIHVPPVAAHICAGLGQSHRNRRAKSAVRAGDQRVLARQLERFKAHRFTLVRFVWGAV